MISSEQPDVESDGPRLFSIIRGGHGSGQLEDLEVDQDEVGAAPGSSTPTDAVNPEGSHGKTDGNAPSPEQDSGWNEHVDGVPAEDAAGGDSDDVEAVAAIISQARALLDDADPVVYYRALKGLVRESHSSVLGPLDYSTELPFHEPARVYVDPVPSNVETAVLYAHAAYPEFEEVLLPGFTDPARADLLVALYDLLFIEGRNVAVVTNHGQIIDIALVMAALFVAMLAEDRTFGVLGERVSPEDMADHTNTLVSRMVTTRQAFGIPAVQVLQNITRVFLSMPQTASRRRAKIDPTLVKANNSLMRLELERRLALGGQLLGMAASGTQDLTIPQLMNRARAAWRHRRGDDPGEKPTLHLQPLYNGTISLIRSCDYVLPVAISLDNENPAVVVGTLTRLREDEDCHRIMDWIALAHQNATGVPTIYHRPEDDLLTHVRSLINR